MHPAEAFESCWIKLKWATEHLDTLRGEVRPWLKSEPYRIVKNYHAETNYHIVSLELNAGKQPPLERWSLIAADCVHNVRTALDQLAYGAAILSSGTNPPPSEGSIQFPIADDPDKFPELMKRYKIDTLKPSVRTAIESMQPYNRPNPHDGRLPSVMALLRDFDNRDKHRLLRLATQQAHSATIDELATDLDTDITNFVVHIGPLQDGAKILSFSTSKPTPDVKYKVIVNLIVASAFGPKPNEFLEVCGLHKWFIEEATSAINIVAGYGLQRCDRFKNFLRGQFLQSFRLHLKSLSLLLVPCYLRAMVKLDELLMLAVPVRRAFDRADTAIHRLRIIPRPARQTPPIVWIAARQQCSLP